MRNKIIFAVVLGLLIVVGIGCSGKKEPAKNAADTQLPSGHPSSFGSMDQGQPSGKPIDGQAVADKISTALDAKFAGEWKVSGTTLKKGAYTENDNYGIVDEVAKIYPGSMVSIFIGQDRVSTNVANQSENGKRVLTGYPTPPAVGETMKSGKITPGPASSMGSSSYQKVYLPLKAGDKTVAVMSVSIPQ